MKFKNITLIAGGVGGAKLAEGFDAINEINLSVIGNIADDDTFHGLWVSPDIDTLTYSLAKIINRDQGWGLRNETFNSLKILSKLTVETFVVLLILFINSNFVAIMQTLFRRVILCLSKH